MTDFRHRMTRREALRRTFAFSAAASLGLIGRPVTAEHSQPGDLHLLAIGDYGSGAPAQKAVAAAMRKYVAQQQLCLSALLMLGDNIYGKLPGGTQSPVWTERIESMYPVEAFPVPMVAVLGNHDYDDQVGKEAIELAYAREHCGRRWCMPSKWYCWQPASSCSQPLVSFLVIDSNFKNRVASLTEYERHSQLCWLQGELQRPAVARWQIVLGHHPLYSNGSHGDGLSLIKSVGPLLQQHCVPLYLCGHDHDLQHLEIDGLATSFVLSGGGGARTRPMKITGRGPYAQSVYGFTHLQVGCDRLCVRMIDANGQQVHAFTRSLDGCIEVL